MTFLGFVIMSAFYGEKENMGDILAFADQSTLSPQRWLAAASVVWRSLGHGLVLWHRAWSVLSYPTEYWFLFQRLVVVKCVQSVQVMCGCTVHRRPLRASSTFLAASPALKPPLETHIRCPSASSNLSSWDGHPQGQWWGKCTHAVGPTPR